MILIDDKIDALKSLKSNINDAISEEIKSIKHVIIDMNAYIQLYESGINAQGVRIDSFRPYTAKTIQIKQSKGQPVDRVTLRDTGAFHGSFDVAVFDDNFRIVALDEKTEKLIAKYGEDILGLSDDNTNEIVWEYIYKALIIKRDSLL